MTQTELNFKSFYPDLSYPYGSQKRKMYDHLKTVCSCTNADFVRHLNVFKYTGRISEIREDLAAFGWTIRAERLHDGLFCYHLEKIYKHIPGQAPGIQRATAMAVV